LVWKKIASHQNQTEISFIDPAIHYFVLSSGGCSGLSGGSDLPERAISRKTSEVGAFSGAVFFSSSAITGRSFPIRIGSNIGASGLMNAAPEDVDFRAGYNGSEVHSPQEKV
jgi:hypothetical protein